MVRILGALLALLLLPTAGGAQPLRTIVPRDSTDWKVTFMEGPCAVSVAVAQPGERTFDPIWIIRGTAVEGLSDQLVCLRLELSDFDIPPLTFQEAEHWNWHWFVRNIKTADFVSLGLVTESGKAFALASSHSLYDYVKDYFEPPTRYSRCWTTVSEALQFREAIYEPLPDALGRITALQIDLALPHEQELWLGPISFGPAREKPETFPRARVTRTAPGKFLAVDLEGDGVPELLTPWIPGEKVWEYDGNAGRFHRPLRRDALGGARLYHHLVAGDLDGDGDPDLVALESDEETLHLLMNRRDGFHGDTLRVPLPEPGAKVTGMALADDDRDGRLDLFLCYHLVSNPNIGRVFRLAGLPGRRFAPAASLPTTFSPVFWGAYQMALADMNGDGILDILAGAALIGVHVFPGLGDGAYGESVLVERMYQNGHLRAIVPGDADGDGDLDIYIAMLNASGGPDRTGQNYLCLNDGDFIFREVAIPWGVTGGPLTEDACFAEIDGIPGPELLTLEGSRLIAFDLRSISRAMALGEPAPGDAVRVLAEDPAILSAAAMMSCQDLDGDGAVEVILSREEGPFVLRLAGSGPVRRLGLRGLGSGTGGIGGLLSGGGGRWTLPVLSTNRQGPGPFLVAAGDEVSLDGTAAPATGRSPGSLQILDSGDPGKRRTGLASLALEARYRLPRLWEYPWHVAKVPGVQAGFGLLLLVAASGSLVMLRRGAARRTEEQSWRALLAAVGISSHAAWRASITHLLRGVRGIRDQAGSGPSARPTPEELDRIREQLPPELLAKMEQAMDVAASLRLEGSGTARGALRELRRLHEGASPDLDGLHRAGHTLVTSLSLIQRLLAERFSCDAREVFRRAAAYRATRGLDPARISWDGTDEALARGFPLLPEDCFTCLDELLANAAKKEPLPGRILVGVHPRGPRGATLRVWDDGVALEAEGARAARAGDRSGLARLGELLAPYGGKVVVEDAPGGGVNAEVRLPRFDLD